MKSNKSPELEALLKQAEEDLKALDAGRETQDDKGAAIVTLTAAFFIAFIVWVFNHL